MKLHIPNILKSGKMALRMIFIMSSLLMLSPAGRESNAHRRWESYL